jgi:hypothetical protein
MRLHAGTYVAAAVVAAVGLLVTAGPFLLCSRSVGGSALAAIGLLGCLGGALTGRTGAAGVVGAAAIGQLAVSAHPSAAAVLVTAVLLATLLATAETLESGRWRAGSAETVAACLPPVCLGLTLSAAAVLAGLAGTEFGLSPTAGGVIGILAVAGALGTAITRLRRPE